MRERTQALGRANASLRAVAEAGLAGTNHELANMNTVMLNREERVVAMKHEVNALLEELHRPKKYGI